MGQYRFAHAYAAVRDGRPLGPWVKGDWADLSDEDAAFIANDSPGALGASLVAEDAPVPPESDDEPEEAEIPSDGDAEPPQTRPARGGRKRAS